MPPFRIEYLCPRQSPYWQALTEGLFFKTPVLFERFEDAQANCNGLVWQYHSARVLDATGQLCYSV